jgi:hypothetical protein
VAVFHNLFSLAAHPDLSKTHGGTPQNVASQKGGTKLYIAINVSTYKYLPYKNAGI